MSEPLGKDGNIWLLAQMSVETKWKGHRRKCMWWELWGAHGSPKFSLSDTWGRNRPCSQSSLAKNIPKSSWNLCRGCSTFCTHPWLLREMALEWELRSSRCLALSCFSNCGRPGISQGFLPANTLGTSAKLLSYDHGIDWGLLSL